jgi:FKBP-type peptidyl-prolyl cis-trans isomerase FklB
VKNNSKNSVLACIFICNILLCTESIAQHQVSQNKPSQNSPVLSHADQLSERAKKLDRANFSQMLSYSMGYSTGRRIQLAKPSLVLNPEYIERGFRDAYCYEGSNPATSVIKPKNSLIPEAQAKQILEDYYAQQSVLNSNTNDHWDQQHIENKRAGEKFFAENAKKKDVVSDPRGFQYQVLVKGTGNPPKITDNVEFHYRAFNTTGIEFKSSYEYEQTEKYPVFESDHKGWDWVLTSMPVGSKWRVFMPSHLAFDGAGELPHLLPGSPVIFDIELLNSAPNIRDIKQKHTGHN